MGNQREIKELYPTPRSGVSLRVLEGHEACVKAILARLPDVVFYTCFVEAGKEHTITNLDCGDTYLAPSLNSTVALQSGGKMWCGYEEFVNHITELAKHIDNVLFLVGD